MLSIEGNVASDQRDPSPLRYRFFLHSVTIVASIGEPFSLHSPSHVSRTIHREKGGEEEKSRREKEKKNWEESAPRAETGFSRFLRRAVESLILLWTRARGIVNLTKEKPPIENEEERERDQSGYLGHTHIYGGLVKTYTKWIMGHRRNPATVKILARPLTTFPGFYCIGNDGMYDYEEHTGTKDH